LPDLLTALERLDLGSLKVTWMTDHDCESLARLVARRQREARPGATATPGTVPCGSPGRPGVQRRRSDHQLRDPRSRNRTTWITVNDGVSTTRSITVTALTTGTRYWFRVAAGNTAGTGPWSNLAHAIPHR
jgi:hypothetical protein